MEHRSFVFTWIAAGLLLGATFKSAESPTWPDRKVPSVTIVRTIAPEAATTPDEVPPAVATVARARSFRAIRNSLIAIDGVVVTEEESLAKQKGEVEVTLVDGRSGELVRTRVHPDDLNGPHGWRWWYQHH